MEQPAGRRLWTVGGLLLAVSDTLAARFATCLVGGELSGFTRAASGHCYFSLKDADGGSGLLRCAMFRRAASWLAFTPRDGQRVELRGRVAIYEPRGELQFVVESMQLAGAGALYEEFLRLKARLEAEGLFDGERKRPLPTHPRRLGVVTSLGAAALRDVTTALARRSPHVGVVIYPSLVQGPDAPPALVQAIGLANQRDEVDALLLCRGGGSLEDLWAFNDERVVRAVAASRLPIVCGVGHESDVTLCDFAADLRAPTPTAAAELAAPRAEDGRLALRHLQQRLASRVRQRLDVQAQRLDAATLRLSRPLQAVRQRGQRLSVLEQRLRGVVPVRLQRAQDALASRAHRLSRALRGELRHDAQRLGALEARLGGLDPRQVLRRGYAWVETPDGRPLGGIAGIRTGDSLRAVLVDGELDAGVTEVRPALPPTPAATSTGTPDAGMADVDAGPAAKPRRPS